MTTTSTKWWRVIRLDYFQFSKITSPILIPHQWITADRIFLTPTRARHFAQSTLLSMLQNESTSVSTNWVTTDPTHPYIEINGRTPSPFFPVLNLISIYMINPHLHWPEPTTSVNPNICRAIRVAFMLLSNAWNCSFFCLSEDPGINKFTTKNKFPTNEWRANSFFDPNRTKDAERLILCAWIGLVLCLIGAMIPVNLGRPAAAVSSPLLFQ